MSADPLVKIVINGYSTDFTRTRTFNPDELWVTLYYQSGSYINPNVFWYKSEIIANSNLDNAEVIDNTGLFPNLVRTPAITMESCKQLTITNAQGISRFFKLSDSDLRFLLSQNYQSTTFSQSFPSDCIGQDDRITVIDFIQVAQLQPISVSQFTATNDQGVSQFFKTRTSDCELLRTQFPSNMSPCFETTDTTGVQDKLVVQDFLLTSMIPPPPTGLVNNLVTVQTACGVKRVVMTPQELLSFQMGNFLPAPAPSTLSYDVLGMVNDNSTYNQFLQIAAACYHVTAPPMTGGGITGGSLFGAVMGLLTLGVLAKHGK